MKIIKQIVSYVLELFMIIYSVFPRNKNIWVTGKTNKWIEDFNAPSFFDNSKYFYLYLSNKTKEKVYWFTSSKIEYNKLKKIGINVELYPSIKSIYIALRAKYFFHHYGKNQINRILQKGAIQINFWHGTPIKKIMYDVYGKNEKKDIFSKLRKKGEIEYLSSTSEYLSSSILEKAFNVDKKNILNFGYPRTDILKLNREEAEKFCEKYSSELIEYIKISKTKKRTFLYMPTYRDYNSYYFENIKINFDKLNCELKKNDSVMFIKLHPLTRFDTKKSNYSNIKFINNDVDIYPFLIFTDYLITDYSSILFDFLLLDREIIFIPYDIKEYVKSREIYYDYEEITPGKKFYTFDEFIKNIHRIDKLNYSEERKKIKNIFINNYNFDASEKTYQYFLDQENNKNKKIC